MRSYNAHDISNFKGSHTFAVSTKEQIEIIAHSTQILTLSGETTDHDGVVRSLIVATGSSIDLKGIFYNFRSLKIIAPSPTVKFGLMVKTSARQLEEPHDPSKPSLYATLPETEETTLQRMVKTVQGYASDIKNDPPLQGQHSRGTMEPENFPFDKYVIDDDERDIFDPTPPQDAHTPQASDPAVQPQGVQPTAAEPQPSPPTNEPQTNDKGQ